MDRSVRLIPSIIVLLLHKIYIYYLTGGLRNIRNRVGKSASSGEKYFIYTHQKSNPRHMRTIN